jgi:hypothetical protein
MRPDKHGISRLTGNHQISQIKRTQTDLKKPKLHPVTMSITPQEYKRLSTEAKWRRWSMSKLLYYSVFRERLELPE